MCARTTQCLPLENKVADTQCSSSQPTSKNTEKDLQMVLGAGGPSTVFLWWKFKIILKEEKRVRHYPETTPQGPSLLSITKQGSEKIIRSNCDNSKRSHFFSLKSYLL